MSTEGGDRCYDEACVELWGSYQGKSQVRTRWGWGKEVGQLLWGYPSLPFPSFLGLNKIRRKRGAQLKAGLVRFPWGLFLGGMEQLRAMDVCVGRRGEHSGALAKGKARLHWLLTSTPMSVLGSRQEGSFL